MQLSVTEDTDTVTLELVRPKGWFRKETVRHMVSLPVRVLAAARTASMYIPLSRFDEPKAQAESAKQITNKRDAASRHSSSGPAKMQIIPVTNLDEVKRGTSTGAVQVSETVAAFHRSASPVKQPEAVISPESSPAVMAMKNDRGSQASSIVGQLPKFGQPKDDIPHYYGYDSSSSSATPGSTPATAPIPQPITPSVQEVLKMYEGTSMSDSLHPRTLPAHPEVSLTPNSLTPALVVSKLASILNHTSQTSTGISRLNDEVAPMRILTPLSPVNLDGSSTATSISLLTSSNSQAIPVIKPPTKEGSQQPQDPEIHGPNPTQSRVPEPASSPAAQPDIGSLTHSSRSKVLRATLSDSTRRDPNFLTSADARSPFPYLTSAKSASSHRLPTETSFHVVRHASHSSDIPLLPAQQQGMTMPIFKALIQTVLAGNLSLPAGTVFFPSRPVAHHLETRRLMKLRLSQQRERLAFMERLLRAVRAIKASSEHSNDDGKVHRKRSLSFTSQPRTNSLGAQPIIIAPPGHERGRDQMQGCDRASTNVDAASLQPQEASSPTSMVSSNLSSFKERDNLSLAPGPGVQDDQRSLCANSTKLVSPHSRRNLSRVSTISRPQTNFRPFRGSSLSISTTMSLQEQLNQLHQVHNRALQSHFRRTHDPNEPYSSPSTPIFTPITPAGVTNSASRNSPSRRPAGKQHSSGAYSTPQSHTTNASYSQAGTTMSSPTTASFTALSSSSSAFGGLLSSLDGNPTTGTPLREIREITRRHPITGEPMSETFEEDDVDENVGSLAPDQQLQQNSQPTSVVNGKPPMDPPVAHLFVSETSAATNTETTSAIPRGRAGLPPISPSIQTKTIPEERQQNLYERQEHDALSEVESAMSHLSNPHSHRGNRQSVHNADEEAYRLSGEDDTSVISSHRSHSKGSRGGGAFTPSGDPFARDQAKLINSTSVVSSLLPSIPHHGYQMGLPHHPSSSSSVFSSTASTSAGISAPRWTSGTAPRRRLSIAVRSSIMTSKLASSFHGVENLDSVPNTGRVSRQASAHSPLSPRDLFSPRSLEAKSLPGSRRPSDSKELELRASGQELLTPSYRNSATRSVRSQSRLGRDSNHRIGDDGHEMRRSSIASHIEKETQDIARELLALDFSCAELQASGMFALYDTVGCNEQFAEENANLARAIRANVLALEAIAALVECTYGPGVEFSPPEEPYLHLSWSFLPEANRKSAQRLFQCIDTSSKGYLLRSDVMLWLNLIAHHDTGGQVRTGDANWSMALAFDGVWERMLREQRCLDGQDQHVPSKASEYRSDTQQPLPTKTATPSSSPISVVPESTQASGVSRRRRGDSPSFSGPTSSDEDTDPGQRITLAAFIEFTSTFSLDDLEALRQMFVDGQHKQANNSEFPRTPVITLTTSPSTAVPAPLIIPPKHPHFSQSRSSLDDSPISH